MGRRSDICWHQIEVQYRLGLKSIREIARTYNIADSNLRARAAKEGWTRGDGEAARIATREAVAEATRSHAAQIGAEIGARQAQVERDVLEATVLSAVEVVREHQLVSRRGVQVANQLLRQLELACANTELAEEEVRQARANDPARAALIDKQLGLRGLVDAFDRWSGAYSKVAQTERQAHRLDSEEKPNEIDALLLKIAAEKASRSH
jgi:hypothetical protein